MNILWISGSWASGATGILAEPIARLLSDLGHHLTYWPLDHDRQFMPEGFSDYRDPVVGLRGLSRLALMGALRRSAATAELIFVEQDLRHEFLVAEVILGLRHRPPLWLLATYPLGHYLAGRGEKRSKWPRRLAEVLYPRFDRILTLVGGVALDLSSRFGVPPDHLRTVPWPAPPWDGREATRQPRVVTIGEVTSLKGLDVLLQVLKLIQDDGLAAELQIVGGGPRLADVMRLADVLKVPTTITPFGPDIGAAIERGGVFSAPQWLDGTGWDIVSAAAAGLPITAVNAPAAPMEILVRGTLGKMVGLGDVDGLKDVITLLLSNQDAWTGYHRAALRLSQRHRPDHIRDHWARTFTLTPDPAPLVP